MTDLLRLTADLVDIPSVSYSEQALADHLEAELRAVPWLEVLRHRDNVVARTALGRPLRLLLAGHIDTVPANGNERAVVAGDQLHGLGACDMKAGLAIALELARTVDQPAVDVTYVFYAGEEVEARHNGLGQLFTDHPDWLAGDAAILGEPTGGAVEAGCQGSLRLAVSLAGRRAHTARPWMGVNAIHRLAAVVDVVAAYEGRRPVLDGCEFREALQAVHVEGGIAGNVVPDRATVTVNHRFAPDRSAVEAEAHVLALLDPVLSEDDAVELLDVADAAAPGLGHPLLRALVDGNGLEVRAKLGWTDVARFAAEGIPACNFGPGDPSLAHSPDEFVDRAGLEAGHAALLGLLTTGAGPI
jgi:succinyl-diaminopimelate desuccinylase